MTLTVSLSELSRILVAAGSQPNDVNAVVEKKECRGLKSVTSSAGYLCPEGMLFLNDLLDSGSYSCDKLGQGVLLSLAWYLREAKLTRLTNKFRGE